MISALADKYWLSWVSSLHALKKKPDLFCFCLILFILQHICGWMAGQTDSPKATLKWAPGPKPLFLMPINPSGKTKKIQLQRRKMTAKRCKNTTKVCKYKMMQKPHLEKQNNHNEKWTKCLLRDTNLCFLCCFQDLALLFACDWGDFACWWPRICCLLISGNKSWSLQFFSTFSVAKYMSFQHFSS